LGGHSRDNQLGIFESLTIIGDKTDRLGDAVTGKPLVILARLDEAGNVVRVNAPDGDVVAPAFQEQTHDDSHGAVADNGNVLGHKWPAFSRQ
jgi:hypothetical protein